MKNLTFLALFLLSWNLYAKNIVVSTGHWPPYAGENLKGGGFINDVVQEAFKTQGVKVEISHVPWARAMEMSKAGKIDGTCCWYKNDKRLKTHYLSDPVYDVKYVFFHRKDFKFDWKNLNDLKNLSLGGIIEYFYGKDLENELKKGTFSMERVKSDHQNFKKLLKGRIQIYPMSDPDAGLIILDKHFKKQEANQITFHPKSFLKDSGVYFMLSKADPKNKDLIKVFNKGLAAIKANGKYDKLLSQKVRGKYPKK